MQLSSRVSLPLEIELVHEADAYPADEDGGPYFELSGRPQVYNINSPLTFGEMREAIFTSLRREHIARANPNAGLHPVVERQLRRTAETAAQAVLDLLADEACEHVEEWTPEDE